MTKQKKGAKLLRIILLALLAMNLLILLLQANSDSGLIPNAPALLQVTGGSMEPKLHNGDAILIVPTPYEKLDMGDVVVFYRGGELITHEIISGNVSGFVTQGAANPLPDGLMGREEYRARVICRIPLLGSIWLMYSSVPLFLCWMILLILLVFGSEIFPAVYDRLKQKKDIS